jgi:hypothetical protein
MKCIIITILILLPVIQPTAVSGRELSGRREADDGFWKREKSAFVFPKISFSPEVHYGLNKFVLSKFQTEMLSSAQKECARKCENILNRSSQRQDIFLVLRSKAHFDNCAFEKSADYIKHLLEKNERLFRKINFSSSERERNRLLKQSLFNAGKILHSIQDFYSHTNYVELMQADHDRFEDVPDLRLWTGAGRESLFALEADGLVSGTTWWSFPRKCSKHVPSHKKLSKDRSQYISAWQPTLWKKPVAGGGRYTHLEAALFFAESASYQFLAETFDKNPLLKSYCCFKN